MCWSISSSAISAIYGYSVAAYLFRRCHSRRDRWYALFLATFTTTQMLDLIFWLIRGDADELPCDRVGAGTLGSLNALLSRAVIPPVIFFQPITLTLFPSEKHRRLVWPYRICTVVAGMIPVVLGGCTTIYRGTMPLALPTLLYDGVQPPMWLFTCGCLFWALGAYLWCTPDLVWHAILSIGGFNLLLLYLLDGTVQLVSKLCFWCLLLSIFFLLDPRLLPPPAKLVAAVDGARATAGAASANGVRAAA